MLISSCVSSEVLGQAASSPFSTFGIGEHYGSAFVNSQGMAGVGIGTPQAWFINSQNPALLAYNSTTIFQAGIVGEFKSIKSDALSQRTSAGNLNYLAMAFPIRPRNPTKPRRWTTSVGLMPYSNVDYLFKYNDGIEGSTNTITVNEKGSGGLSKLYWSNGVRITKNIAVGIQGAYLFGSIVNEYTNQLDQTNQVVPYVISISERTYVKDFNFTAGVSFLKDSIFGDNHQFSAGIVYALNSHLNGTKTTKFSRLDLSENVIDSLTLASAKGNLFIPAELGVGFSYSRGINWNIGADFRYQDWSNFKSLDAEDEENLVTAWRLAVGGELTPDPFAVDGFFKKVTYRAGLSMEKMPFLANNKQVNDFGINFGFSVPTGRSSIDLAFKVGKRGNKSENILEESYFKVYFGLTFNDQWFIRRKFD